MTFEEARALFPVLESVAYLNAGTFGPLARPVAEALESGVERDLTVGRTGKAYFEETLALRDDLRRAFGALVGTGPESVTLTTSTTDGCGTTTVHLPTIQSPVRPTGGSASTVP